MKRRWSVLYNIILKWRVHHINESNFVLILSIVVGIVTGLVAFSLKSAIFYTHEFLVNRLEINTGNVLFFLLPLIGIWLTHLFIKYYVKDDLGHGVTKVLHSISRQNSIIKPHNNYTSMIATTFTIGFGGSVGTEATIVLTGSSIGSNLARFFRMNYKVMTLMVGCGAAGAISGIFKAPITGVFFTLEILLLDLTMASLIPLILTAMTSYVVSFMLLGKSLSLSFPIINDVVITNIPYYLILGIICGVGSIYFIRANLKIEDLIKSIKNQNLRILIGGSILGILIFIFPSLFGEGYEVLKELVNGNTDILTANSYFFEYRSVPLFLIVYSLSIVLIKVIATALTNGSGGVGGTFAPCLFMGGMLGFTMGSIVNYTGLIDLPVPYFILAGMAGVMSGVMSSPLTAMFLIAETSGGYQLLLPLMLVSVVSYLTVKRVEPHSIYARRLAKQGELLTHNKDKSILTLMKLNRVIETDFRVVHVDATLGDLVKEVSLSSRNIFPVINYEEALIGVVILDDIRKIMFDHDLYNKTTVRDFMITPPVIVDIHDKMDVVMKYFEDTKVWNLPVTEDGKYKGFISKSKIFSTYRRVLQHYSDE